LPQDFADQRETYYEALKLPLDATTFISNLQQAHADALQMLNDGLPTNPHVRITEKQGGWIELAPLTAQPEPQHLGLLKTELLQRWGMTSLLDMLHEADARIGFTDSFTSLTSREQLDRPTLRKRLLLCLYGLGTNTGLKRMAVGNADVSYKDLLYVRRRFITADHLRAAIAQIVNATLAVRLTSIWGTTTTACASDGKKFGAWEQNLRTRWHPRKPGPGVVVYWHVEKKASCVYSSLQTCTASEVIAMIQGVLRHCTDMSIEQHYVDSHGQSEVAFGLCHLLQIDLLPRLRPIHSQKLYLPDSSQSDHYPHLKTVLTRPINWALIQQQYDDLVKYASALQSGVADAEAILRRFTRNVGHATYKAMAELGRVIKTIFLCRYLHNLELRREINAGLNVIENWNSANSFIFYGRNGEISTNRRDDQDVAMLTLHLLQNSLVYVNTLMLQDVLAEPAWLARMTATDLRALTPLIYQHVNPYGIFQLDLERRLPFTNASAA
jgi:TnpA family transposase